MPIPLTFKDRLEQAESSLYNQFGHTSFMPMLAVLLKDLDKRITRVEKCLEQLMDLGVEK